MTEIAFEGWAIVELMGQRQRPGYAKEVEIAGGKMLRIDIPTSDGDVTEFYGTSAIYSIRPAAEEIVRGEIDRWNDPRPVRPVTYREREPAPQIEVGDDDGPFDQGGM